jgi:hypothetical protein
VHPLGEVCTAPVNANDGDRPLGILLDDLVSDPQERAAHIIAVEDDRCGFHLLLPGLSGPG